MLIKTEFLNGRMFLKATKRGYPFRNEGEQPNQENSHSVMFKGLHPIDLADIQVLNHRDAFGLHLIKSLC
jgi:hypothetical protein